MDWGNLGTQWIARVFAEQSQRGWIEASVTEAFIDLSAHTLSIRGYTWIHGNRDIWEQFRFRLVSSGLIALQTSDRPASRVVEGCL